MNEPNAAALADELERHAAACKLAQQRDIKPTATDAEVYVPMGKWSLDKVAIVVAALRAKSPASPESEHVADSTDLVGWFCRCSCGEDCETETEWLIHLHDVIRALQAALKPASPGDGGANWSFLRNVLLQGAAIQQDYAAGKYSNYEEYSARMDEAARERCDELFTAPPQAEQAKCPHGKPIIKFPYITDIDCEQCWKDICAAAPQPAEQAKERRRGERRTFQTEARHGGRFYRQHEDFSIDQRRPDRRQTEARTERGENSAEWAIVDAYLHKCDTKYPGGYGSAEDEERDLVLPISQLVQTASSEGHAAGFAEARGLSLIAASECAVQKVPEVEFEGLGAETIYTFGHAAGVLSATDAIRKLQPKEGGR